MRKSIRGSIAATGAVVLGLGLGIAAPAAAEETPVEGFTFYDAGDVEQLEATGGYPSDWFFGRHGGFGDDERTFKYNGVEIEGVGSLLRNLQGKDIAETDAIAQKIDGLDVYATGDAFPKLVLYVGDDEEETKALILGATGMDGLEDLDTDGHWGFQTQALESEIREAEGNDDFTNHADSFTEHLEAAANAWDYVELRAYGFHVNADDTGKIAAVKDGDSVSIFQHDAEAVPSIELGSDPVNDEDFADVGVGVSGQNWYSGSDVEVSVSDEGVTKTFITDSATFQGNLSGDLDKGTYTVHAEVVDPDGVDPLNGYISEATLEITSTSFDDVSPDSTSFSDEITWLADEGITTGYDDGTFRPKNTITREAMAAFLYRAAGKPEVSGEADFTDLDSTSFSDEITWLADEGITEGYDDGTFRPKNKITREAMAAFLHRAAGAPEVSGEAEFTDLDSTSFSDEITWLADEGITEGYDDDTFRPKNKITREAMAAFLYRR